MDRKPLKSSLLKPGTVSTESSTETIMDKLHPYRSNESKHSNSIDIHSLKEFPPLSKNESNSCIEKKLDSSPMKHVPPILPVSNLSSSTSLYSLPIHRTKEEFTLEQFMDSIQFIVQQTPSMITIPLDSSLLEPIVLDANESIQMVCKVTILNPWFKYFDEEVTLIGTNQHIFYMDKYQIRRDIHITHDPVLWISMKKNKIKIATENEWVMIRPMNLCRQLIVYQIMSVCQSYHFPLQIKMY